MLRVVFLLVILMTLITLQSSRSWSDESHLNYFYVQLYFDPDRFNLTPDHETQIRNLITKYNEQGGSGQIQIAAWPVKKKSDPDETSLGDKRENEIKTYLKKQYPAVNVLNKNLANNTENIKKFKKFTNISNQRSLEEDWTLDSGSYFPKADRVSSKAIVFAVLKSP